MQVARWYWDPDRHHLAWILRQRIGCRLVADTVLPETVGEEGWRTVLRGCLNNRQPTRECIVMAADRGWSVVWAVDVAMDVGSVEVVVAVARENVQALPRGYFRFGDQPFSTRLTLACYIGNAELVDLVIAGGATDWDKGLWGACHGGHRALAELMIDKGAGDWDLGLYNACQGGHRDLAELMIERGANDWNRGLRYACQGGHLDLAELMIEKGATKCLHCNHAKHWARCS